MSLCNVYGYIVDGSNTPREGVRISFIPASIPAVDATTGAAIIPFPIYCITTSSGYFSANLRKNTDFLVIINAIGLKERIRTPDSDSVGLFELTGVYVSGDATPNDTNETNW